MNATKTISQSISESARRRMLNVRGEPLFLCAWQRAVFIHYRVDPEVLQRDVPFPLDLHQGRAYVSVVAFTMRNMRPRVGGRFAAMLLTPIATHGFLNVRTYVKREGEVGIYFLAEWLPKRLGLLLGPPLFGLPYRYARLEYRHDHKNGTLRGVVSTRKDQSRLEYAAELHSSAELRPCEAGSLEEFLMERYTAFTANRLGQRLFRIWHSPWLQTHIGVWVAETGLLTELWPWFRDARATGANYSPGFRQVWMGRPQRFGKNQLNYANNGEA